MLPSSQDRSSGIPMNRALRLRLAALTLAIATLVVASAWSVRTAWLQIAELTEGLLIAEHVGEAVVKLQGELQKAELAGAAPQWQQLLDHSRALAAWIEEQRPFLETAHERALLARIASDYARYLSHATAFVEQLRGSELTSLEERQMAELLDQLSAVRRESVGQFLADSHRYIATLQKVNFSLLLTTAALAAWLSFTAYRGIVVPLRRELVNTGAALERAEKLASLAVLASGVAHEIRNPLTAIKARLYTHQKRFAGDSPEAEDTIFISEEIGRLERIVREFLQFARPGDPQLAPVSPAELLGEVRELLAPQLGKLSIELTVADAVATPVRADRQQIKQVLINLVRNAAESIGHDGRVTLRARQRRIGFGGRAWEAVTLEVKDTGPGISAEVQKHLFDPFFTTKASGTGLGLSIAARIVEKHGGALRFSTSKKGATFRLVLPIAKTP